MGIWGEAGVVAATSVSDSKPESHAGISQSVRANWPEAAASGGKESDSEGAGVSESDHLSHRRPREKASERICLEGRRQSAAVGGGGSV